MRRIISMGIWCKMMTNIKSVDNLSYILYYKSMNGLKNCIDLSHAVNELHQKTLNDENINLLLNTRNKVGDLHRQYQSYAIDAIVYFQAMIESDVNQWIKQYEIKSGSFANKWKGIQTYFNIESDYFDKWHKVYQQYRVTFLHADEEKIKENIEKFNDLTIYELYNSIKNGWFAYVEVKYNTSKEDYLELNWKQNMSNQQINNLKNNLFSFNEINSFIEAKILPKATDE